VVGGTVRARAEAKPSTCPCPFSPPRLCLCVLVSVAPCVAWGCPWSALVSKMTGHGSAPIVSCGHHATTHSHSHPHCVATEEKGNRTAQRTHEGRAARCGARTEGRVCVSSGGCAHPSAPGGQ
jgi:hypothetical protein